MWRKIQLVHEAEKGTEGTDTQPEKSGEATPEPKAEPKFTQDDINRIIDERLARERRQQQEKDEANKKTVEELLLIEQGKFKELSDRREKEIGDLSGALDAHKSAVTKYLEHLRKQVPATVLTLLDKLSAVDQLDWIATNIESLKQEAKQPPAPAGVPATPKPNGSGASAEEQDAAKRELARQQHRIF